MIMDVKQTLENVVFALSNIEVKGEKNLNLLLASIKTVREVADFIGKDEKNESDS